MRFVLILLLLFSAGADAARVAPTRHPERVHRNLRITVYEGENPADESSVTYSTESNAEHAVLVLEGDLNDPRCFSFEESRVRLEVFLEQLEDGKHKHFTAKAQRAQRLRNQKIKI
ncbi:MAG TPA: hypothetical protein PLK99_07705, partial [Burkholderiales bacterium]|nr:hypothetical protein [Burkholderiales bacterium]